MYSVINKFPNYIRYYKTRFENKIFPRANRAVKDHVKLISLNFIENISKSVVRERDDRARANFQKPGHNLPSMLEL